MGKTRCSPEGRHERDRLEDMGRRGLRRHKRQFQMLHDPNHDGVLRDVSYIPLQVERGIGLTSPLELPPSCRKMHARRPFSSNRPVRLTLPQGGGPVFYAGSTRAGWRAKDGHVLRGSRKPRGSQEGTCCPQLIIRCPSARPAASWRPRLRAGPGPALNPDAPRRPQRRVYRSV